MTALSLLVLWLFLGTGSGADTGSSSDVDPVALQWRRFSVETKDQLEGLIRKALPHFGRAQGNLSLSAPCTGALLKVLFGVKDMRTWAFQMLDAWGRPPSGILRGSLSDLGDFDECLEVRLSTESGQEKFRGQYCSVHVHMRLPPMPHKATLATKIKSMENISAPGTVFQDMMSDSIMLYRSETRLGICVPSICTKDDVQGAMQGILGNSVSDVRVSSCEVDEGSSIPTEQIVTLCLLLAFLAFICVATILDLLRQNYKIESIRFDNVAHSLRHFSMYTNGVALLRTEGPRMRCVDGARFLSMVWLLLAHTYGTLNTSATANQKRIVTMVKEVSFQVITNPTLSVDTFFVIGGFMVAYSTLKALDKSKGRLNVVRFVIRRVWRLLPPMVMTLGLLYLMPMLGSGPLWKEVVHQQVDLCRKRWWTVVFLLTSWVPWKEMCLSHTWYLSVDFQLFLLTPVVLVLLHRRPPWGLFVIALYMLSGAAVMVILTLLFDLYPAYIFVTPDEDYSGMVGDVSYYKPYAHVGPYFVGVLMGYLLYRYPDLVISKYRRWCLWTLSLLLTSMTLFGTYPWNVGHLPSMGVAAISQAFLRTGWAIGVAWILYACIRQDGGVVGAILSWKILLPLGKLSYTMYLYQFLVLWYRNGVRRNELYLNHFEVVYEFFGGFVATLGLSLVGYLVAEAPFVSLDTVIFPKKVSCQEKDKMEPAPKSVTHL